MLTPLMTVTFFSYERNIKGNNGSEKKFKGQIKHMIKHQKIFMHLIPFFMTQPIQFSSRVTYFLIKYYFYDKFSLKIRILYIYIQKLLRKIMGMFSSYFLKIVFENIF